MGNMGNMLDMTVFQAVASLFSLGQQRQHIGIYLNCCPCCLLHFHKGNTIKAFIHAVVALVAFVALCFYYSQLKIASLTA